MDHITTAILKGACSRTFPNVDCQKVEEAIAVTLKHAPHRRSTNQAIHTVAAQLSARRNKGISNVLIPDDLVEDEEEEEEEGEDEVEDEDEEEEEEEEGEESIQALTHK
ncbi:unnamed protein product [Boreogadus saida]